MRPFAALAGVLAACGQTVPPPSAPNVSEPAEQERIHHDGNTPAVQPQVDARRRIAISKGHEAEFLRERTANVVDREPVARRARRETNERARPGVRACEPAEE